MSNGEERGPNDAARHGRPPTRREFVIAAGMAPVMMGVTGGREDMSDRGHVGRHGTPAEVVSVSLFEGEHQKAGIRAAESQQVAYPGTRNNRFQEMTWPT